MKTLVKLLKVFIEISIKIELFEATIVFFKNLNQIKPFATFTVKRYLF